MGNRLVAEGDDLLYSAYDVFLSDKDENEFLDTLNRILKI